MVMAEVGVMWAVRVARDGCVVGRRVAVVPEERWLRERSCTLPTTANTSRSKSPRRRRALL